MGLAKVKESDTLADQPVAQPSKESQTLEKLIAAPRLYYRPGDHEQYPWSPLPWKGISKKVLFFDPCSGATLDMARFELGATFPEHFHTTMQATFVLKGRLQKDDGDSMVEGSFYLSEAGEIQRSIVAATETILYRYFAGVPVYIFSDGSTFITRPDGSVSVAGRLDLLRKGQSTNLISP